MEWALCVGRAKALIGATTALFHPLAQIGSRLSKLGEGDQEKLFGHSHGKHVYKYIDIYII